MPKKTIHYSKFDLHEIDQVGSLLGIGSIKAQYGTIPKVSKFSVTFLLKALESIDKVIPDLKDKDLDKFFQAIKNLRKQQRIQEKAQDLQNQAKR